MKPKFNIKDYPSNCVMHCQTETEANIFCKYLADTGHRWCTGEPYTEHNNHWSDNKFGTCYEFNSGSYSSNKFYEDLPSYTVLEFDSFDWSEFKPKFDIDKYQGDFFMSCDTLEKERIFCQYLETVEECKRPHWARDIKRTVWEEHKNLPHYSTDFYVRKGYTMLNFDEFNWSDVQRAGRSYIMIGQDVLLDYLKRNLTFVRAAKGNEVAINILEAIIKDIDEWRD